MTNSQFGLLQINTVETKLNVYKALNEVSGVHSLQKTNRTTEDMSVKFTSLLELARLHLSQHFWK